MEADIYICDPCIPGLTLTHPSTCGIIYLLEIVIVMRRWKRVPSPLTISDPGFW